MFNVVFLGANLLILILQGVPTNSLHCLSCNDVLSPVLCHRVQECQPGEACLTETYTLNGENLYNLGCYSTTACAGKGKRASRRSLLNSQVGAVHCTNCCEGDGCNKEGCGASEVTANFGPLCFNCHQTRHPSNCPLVKTCQQNEVCYISKVSELGFTFYSTSCLQRSNCPRDAANAFGRRKRDSNGFTGCCAGDLCNTGGNDFSGTLPPLPTGSGGSSGIGIIIQGNTSALPQNPPTTQVAIQAKDCKELMTLGVNADGVYTIYPAGAATKVYCDMTTDGGGWTVVLHKHVNGTVLFNGTWADYKNGFGKPDGEHWKGNELIRTLSQLGKTDVFFKLLDMKNQTEHAKWRNFSVGSESEGYRLTFDRLSYDGDAGNTLNNTNPWYTHYGMKFTTRDKDSDTYDSGNCAELVQGGWWFSGCYSVSPTAMSTRNFVWLNNKYGYYELRDAVMMLRRE